MILKRTAQKIIYKKLELQRWETFILLGLSCFVMGDLTNSYIWFYYLLQLHLVFYFNDYKNQNKNSAEFLQKLNL